MKTSFKLAAFAAALLGATGLAHADPAETKGGIKIKTEDGRFEATVGGRIQFDYYSFSEDEGARIGTTAFGSAVPGTGGNRGGAAFRRAYLTLTGKAYGWDYKFENDFAGATCGAVNNNAVTVTSPTAGTTNLPACNAGTNGFREMWIGTKVGPGKLIIGQHKPFRGMEELASSNEITLIERPNTTATGIYSGRQFLTGLFYKGNAEQFGYGAHASTLGSASQTTEGHSFGARAYYFPLSEDGRTVHLGLAYSTDREDGGSATTAAVFQYGGRRGVGLGLGNAGASLGSGLGTQSTIHAEVAGSIGSFTAQAEYAMATLENQFDTATAQDQDADITAYYVQGSYFLTGEKKVYKKDRGAFGSPKPNNSWGAVEAVVRYEASENDETVSGQARGCALGGVGSTAAPFQKCEASQVTVGANWYVNPNVRFMLNYYLAEADVNSAAQDEPEAVTVRAQFGF